MLRRFLRRPSSVADAPVSRPAVPAGLRVYAVGDIHGRLDLLDALLARIAADDADRGPAETHLVFLGDLVDRGPDSRGVVERVRTLVADRPHTRHLTGNHEEVFLLALDGDAQAMRLFARIGGRETLASYGIDEDAFARGSFRDLADLARACVPEAHSRFLASGEDLIVYGDYALVHAGVRPGVPLDQQKPADLRWIREDFLDFDGLCDKFVVHGHTITPEADQRPHRIGIDTGAFMSGRLTALGLEGTARWLLDTAPDAAGEIAVAPAAAA